MAIQHNPEYAEAYYYRAAIKRDLKDEGFVDDYRKAIQIKPELKAVNDADVLTILKIFLTMLSFFVSGSSSLLILSAPLTIAIICFPVSLSKPLHISLFQYSL